MSFLGYGLLITQIFMSVSMSLLWGLMNTMQMFINLKLLNILMPLNAQVALFFMENLANFKIVKKVTDAAVSYVFRFLPESKDDDSEDIEEDSYIETVKLFLLGTLAFSVAILVILFLYKMK
jgi:hypothetical protein